MLKFKASIPQFDIKKLEDVIFDRGMKVLEKAARDYLREAARAVAIDTGMAVSAFTPLSRFIKGNIVQSEINRRQKRPFGDGRSPALGEQKSGVEFDVLNDLIFQFTVFSAIEHLIFLEYHRSTASGSPFHSLAKGRKAFAENFAKNKRRVFPVKSDRVIRKKNVSRI